MKLLITGGCGFLGSNLAAYGLQNDYDITVYDNLSRLGSGRNLEWLKSLGNFRFVHGDVRCRNDVENVLKSDRFDAVFHVAGQVAMTTSIENPYGDFETNVMGTLNVLETIRKYSPETGMLFSSTNKVYGDLEQFTYVEKGNRYVCEEFPQGFPESLPFQDTLWMFQRSSGSVLTGLCPCLWPKDSSIQAFFHVWKQAVCLL